MIATDGVFSVGFGYLAKLPEITKLAEKYEALVMVRRTATRQGFMAPRAKGTPAHFGVDVELF